MGDGLEILQPRSRQVSFAGETIAVRPLTIGQILAVRRALDGVDVSGGFGVDEIPKLLLAHSDQVLNALAAAVNLSRPTIEAADAAELLDLLVAVIEENTDFFVRRLIPSLRGVVAKVAAVAKEPGPGLTPSRRSSAPGTT